jgi:hypothetical protein
MCGDTPVAITYAGAVTGSESTCSVRSSTNRAWPYRMGKPWASATSAYLACRRRSMSSCFWASSAGMSTPSALVGTMRNGLSSARWR